MTFLRSRPVGYALYLLILMACAALLTRGFTAGLSGGPAFAHFTKVDLRFDIGCTALSVFVLAGIALYFRLCRLQRTLRVIIAASVLVAVVAFALAMVTDWYPIPAVS